MEMADYIFRIIRSNPMVMFSWGFSRPTAIDNGLRFVVNGFLHQGTVEVKYIEGLDTFKVTTFKKDGSIKSVTEDVYLDSLVMVIDGMVERCPDYGKRVDKEYGLNNG